MLVKNLANIPVHELIDSFLLAFENYFVKVPTDHAYYIQRWKAANVDFNLSYGMFDQDKLVGFIIHAVDTRNGIRTAYNTGTGVIPAYRDKRIVKSIYEYALKDLAQHGIPKTTLEVITKNEIAIKAYQGIGFKICKHYKCFRGEIQLENEHSFELQKVNWENIDWKSLPNQQYYSWDHQKETLAKGDFQFYYVLYHGEIESFFILNPERKYLAQCDLLHSNEQAWERLFAAIQQESSTISLNNVDTRSAAKIQMLHKIGLDNSIDQYEMELNIK